MLGYLIVVYLPFTIALILSGQDVWHVSLSRIAYQRGAPQWLVLFGVLTLPFMLYLVLFYARIDRRRAKSILVAILLFAGAVLFAGMFLPDHGWNLLAELHLYIEDSASVVAMLAITGMVAHYCITGCLQQRTRRILLGVCFGLFAVAAAAWFLIHGTSALYEMVLSWGAMAPLYLINRWTVSGAVCCVKSS